MQFSNVVRRPWEGTDRSENAVEIVAGIKRIRVIVRGFTFWEVSAEIVVSRDVEKFRLRAPRLGRPVFAASNTGAELCALMSPRSLGLVDRGSTGLRVDRCKDIVIGEREGMYELEVITIQNPKVAVATRVSCGLGELSIDFRVDQERCRDLIPVEAVVWSVLVIALDLAGVGVESKRRVCVQIVTGPIVGDPRPGIPCAPVRRV